VYWEYLRRTLALHALHLPREAHGADCGLKPLPQLAAKMKVRGSSRGPTARAARHVAAYPFKFLDRRRRDGLPRRLVA